MSDTIINQRQIHWFPGHMAKTLRMMEREIRNVDCVLQVLDARIPLSSLNPEIERINPTSMSSTRRIWPTRKSPANGWPTSARPGRAVCRWIPARPAGPARLRRRLKKHWPN